MREWLGGRLVASLGRGVEGLRARFLSMPPLVVVHCAARMVEGSWFSDEAAMSAVNIALVATNGWNENNVLIQKSMLKRNSPPLRVFVFREREVSRWQASKSISWSCYGLGHITQHRSH